MKIKKSVTELEGHRWDAILLNETWRHELAELWEIYHKHIFMGAGVMLNKRWRKRIIDTEYINERAITTTILVNRPTHQIDECVLPTLEICGSPR